MRKILFFIVLLPFFATLGHDLYMFYTKPETRFRFSDVGFIWAKYHPQSHDQWKAVLFEIGDTINETIEQVVPEDEAAQNTPDQVDTEHYGESFTQVDQNTGARVAIPTDDRRKAVQRVEGAKNVFGHILECRAVFVSAGFALLVFLINAIFFRGEKETNVRSLGRQSYKAQKGKKGGKNSGYQYTRK